MTFDLLHLGHQALFGGVAALGFAVLFNIAPKTLPWCFAAGALALSVRTLGQEAGWSLEAASFCAALVTGICGRALRFHLGSGGDTMALAGCIPMVPGAFFSQGLMGLFAVTAPQTADAATTATIVFAMQQALRVLFTLGAIGTGLLIPSHLLRERATR